MAGRGRRKETYLLEEEQIARDLGTPGIKLLIFTVPNIEMI